MVPGNIDVVVGFGLPTALYLFFVLLLGNLVGRDTATAYGIVIPLEVISKTIPTHRKKS